MTEPTMDYEKAEVHKVHSVLLQLQLMCQGPREAYAVLVTALWQLNQIAERPISIDDFVTEVSASLRSVTEIRKMN